MTPRPPAPDAAADPRGPGGAAPGAEACDVVIVPDFQGPRADVFEARTLLFLGSWLEHAGEARRFPLHLACIGRPPVRVRRLAERCGAAVTEHAPVGADYRGMSNKLRGLEIQGRHPCVLLLDVDIAVLGDPSPVARLGRCLALAPVTRVRLPLAEWERIYGALGMDLPRERVTSVIGEVMPPFYNGGVVYAPWDAGLRPLWEENARRVRALFAEGDASWPEVAGKDQVGLATAVEALKRRGVPFSPLPDVFNTRLHHLGLGMVRAADVRIFHATGLLSGRTPRALALGHQIRFYRAVMLWRLVGLWRAHGGAASRRPALGAALRDAYAVGRRLQRIHAKYVVSGPRGR